MNFEPRIVEHDAVPYLAVPAQVAIGQIGAVAPGKFDELHLWMAENGFDDGILSFIRYHAIDANALCDVEFGVTVAHAAPGHDGVIGGVLPGGRYAMVSLTGPYDNLFEANMALEEWAREKRVDWEVEPVATAERFACRYEAYRVNPAQTSNPADYETDVLIKIA